MLSIIFQKKLSKKIVLILWLLMLLFFSFEAKAALQIKYPDIQIEGETIRLTTQTELPTVIKYWFYWAIIIGALIAFGSLIYGGFRYLTSTGNPEAMKDAMGQIKAAFLGLTILLGSFLVLRMINPQLTVVSYEPIAIDQGVVLYQGTVKHSIASSKPAIQRLFGKDFKPQEIQIKSEDIKARFYPLETYNGAPSKWFTYENTNKGQIKPAGFIIKSVEIQYEGPAVYLYNQERGNPGKASISLRTSVSNLSKALSWGPKEAKYIQIKNTGSLLNPTSTSSDFVAVLYRDREFRGYCRVFYEDFSDPQWPGKPITRNHSVKIPCSTYEFQNYGCEINSAHIFNMNRTQNRLNDCVLTLYKNNNFDKKNGYCHIRGTKELLKPTKIADLIGSNKPYNTDNCKKLMNIAGNVAKVNSISVSSGCALVAWAAESEGARCEFLPEQDIPDLRQTSLKTHLIGGEGRIIKTGGVISKIAIYPLK